MHAPARPQTGQYPSWVGQYLSRVGQYPSQKRQNCSQSGTDPTQNGQHLFQAGQYHHQDRQYQSQAEEHQPRTNQCQPEIRQDQSRSGQCQPQIRQDQSRSGQCQPQIRRDQSQSGQCQPQFRQDQSQSGQCQPQIRQDQSRSGQCQPQFRQDQSQSGQCQPQIGQDQSWSGQCQPQIRWDQSQSGQCQPQFRPDQSQSGQCQPQIGWDKSQSGQCQTQIRWDQSQLGQCQPQIRQEQSLAEQTPQNTRVSTCDAGDRNGNQVSWTQGVFPSNLSVLLMEGKAQTQNANYTLQNGAYGSGQTSNWPVTPAPNVGLQLQKNVNQSSTTGFNNLVLKKTTNQSLNHAVVSTRDRITPRGHNVQPKESSALDQAFSKSTGCLRSSNQQFSQAAPLHCPTEKGFYVTVSEDRSGSGFKVDKVVFLGTQRKRTRWEWQGFSPSENPPKGQSQQSAAKVSQQRNDPQQLPVKQPLLIHLLDSQNKPHNSSQKAVAVVQPLSQPDHQGIGLQGFSGEANDLHKDTTGESSSILKEMSMTRPSADDNANSIPLKDPVPVDQNLGLESTTEEQVLATTEQNTGAFTVMCSDPITPEMTQQIEELAKGLESQITDGISNNGQSQVTAMSQPSVTSPLAGGKTDQMKEIQRKDDQAAERFGFSSVPVIPWTYDQWTKLIKRFVKAHMKSEPTEVVNVAKKILTMFWEESYENILMETDCIANLINSVEEFCRKHVTPDTVIFNYVSKKSLQQTCLVLEHGQPPPVETYTSLWLNTNEQLDDIDKEFGFPWSLKYNLERDPQPFLTEKENEVVGHVAGEARDDMSLTEFTAPSAGQSVESSILSTRDDIPQTPDTLEMETESVDHDYSFKISVLSPEEAKIIFEELNSGKVKTAETDNQPGNKKDNSAMEEMPEMVNINLNEVQKSKVQVSTPEFCCITRWMEALSGSNKKSLFNCQCTQDPSPDDVTVNRSEIGKEVQVENLNVISLEFAMEDEVNAEHANDTNDETGTCKRKAEPTERISPFLKKIKVKAPFDHETQPAVVDSLKNVSQKGNTDELEPNSSNVASVKLALYGSSLQQAHSKHTNGTNVNNKGSLKSHLPSKKRFFSDETLPPPITITVNASYKQRGPSEPVPEVGSPDEQMLPEIGCGTTSECSSPSEQPVEQYLSEMAPILSSELDKLMELAANPVRKRIHEQWKHHHVPTNKKSKKTVMETQSSPSKHKAKSLKARAVSSTSREDLLLSTTGRSAAVTKTKKPLSPTAKENFLSFLKQRIVNSRTRLDLPKRQTEVRSMQQIGNPIFKPFQGKSVLKFTVLPNTFLFNDEPAKAKKSSDSPSDTPVADDAKNKHHNPKSQRPKGDWVPRPEKKSTPPPGAVPQTDKTTNTFQQYQQKFIRKQQTANKTTG